MARKTRYTVYDVMEEKGVFDKNSANPQSGGYKGPMQYPKMLYHPNGETRITQKAEVLMTPFGPTKVGEHRELLTRIVNDEVEEKAAVEEGWHPHPSRSMAAAGLDAPQMAPPRRIEDLKMRVAELERMKKELELLEAAEKKPSSNALQTRT